MRRAAVLVLLALTVPAAAQPPRPPISSNGTEAFRAVVARYGLKPLSDLKELAEDPRRTLLISFRGADERAEPFKDQLDRLTDDGIFKDGLREFLDRGGAVLVATDQFTGDFAWARDLGVGVAGVKIHAAAGQGYHQRDDFPYVKRAPDLDESLNLFKNTQSGGVATNRPSFLHPFKSKEFETLAVFDGRWRLEGLAKDSVRPLPFAQGGRLPEGGRFLLLADHSVFINGMLVPPVADNNNLEFARNCLDWLTASPDQQRRDRVLFIDDGKVVTDFNLLLRELPPPTPEEILDFLWENRDKASPIVATLEDEGWFSALEQEDIFNRMLLSQFRHWEVVRFILFLGTMALFGYGIRRVIGAKQNYLKKVPRLSLALERLRPRAGLLEQRLRGAVRAGQYYEAARIKARELFADLNLTPAIEGLPAQVEINAGWWRRHAIERDLREIWQIAFGIEPVSVPAKKWDKWQTRLRNLGKLISDGVIKFEG